MTQSNSSVTRSATITPGKEELRSRGHMINMFFEYFHLPLTRVSGVRINFLLSISRTDDSFLSEPAFRRDQLADKWLKVIDESCTYTCTCICRKSIRALQKSRQGLAEFDRQIKL